jgi:hypothetical protein
MNTDSAEPWKLPLEPRRTFDRWPIWKRIFFSVASIGFATYFALEFPICILPGAVALWGVAGFRWKLVLDGPGKTYAMERGLLPFADRHIGPMSDIVAVEIDIKVVHGEDASTTTYPLRVVFLNQKPFYVYASDNFRKSAGLAKELALLTNSKVTESFDLVRKRETFKVAPYDDMLE